MNIIIPPFVNIRFENIRKAAEFIGLELEEHVYFPNEDGKLIKSKTKVPVGIQYYSAMEQTGEDYESTRAVGKYVEKTGQPTKGKKRGGGQSLGNLDVYNLLTYDAPHLMDEIFSIRSDDAARKREVLTNLRLYGQTSIPKKTSESKTKELLNVYLTALGLNKNSLF